MLTLDSPPKERFALPLPIRIGLLGGLIALLFAATMHNEAIYVLLGQFWKNVFIHAGLSQHLPSILRPDGAIGQVTNRSRDIPAVVTYSLLYLGLCLAILFLVLPYPQQRRLVLVAYGLACSASLLLLVVTKLGVAVFAALNSQLIHFIVSPMPVIVLAPLIWWYTPRKQRS